MKNKHFLSDCILFLILILFLSHFCGCEKRNELEKENTSEVEIMTAEGGPSVFFPPVVHNDDVLTGVWTWQNYCLPIDWSFSAWAFAPDSDSIIAAANRYIFSEDGGEIRFERTFFLLTPDGDAVIWEDAPDTGEDPVGFIAFYGNSLYWSVTTGNGTELFRRNDADGDTESVTVDGYFDTPRKYPRAEVMDRSGHIVLTAGEELVMLDENLALLAHIDLPGEADCVRLSPDRRAVVYARVGERELSAGEAADGSAVPLTESGMAAVFGVADIDPDTCAVGDFVVIPWDETLKAKRAGYGDTTHSVLFPASPVWDFCYTGKDGVCTASWDEDGNLVTGETLNWSNSNLLSGAYSLEAVLDADTLLLRDERNANGRAALALFRRAADIWLSEMITLTVAHTVELPTKIQAKIADFNRLHPDVKVVLKDYKAMDDTGTRDKNEGAEQLALDLTLGATGIDLLIAGQRADSPELSVITGSQAYLNLSSFMERDPLVNRDNLFGAVLRLYSTDDGGIWGLTDRLALNTLVSSSKIVGAREEHISSWTTAEMLDLAESLPTDAALTQGLYWGPPFGTLHIRDLLGADGWGAYLDQSGGTCSFDSPEFVRLLHFLSSIPANQDAFRRSAPDGLLDQNDLTSLAALYRSGKLALKTTSFPSLVSFMNLYVDFDEDDWIVMGYPDSGTAAVPGNSMLILKDCAEPDLAWELLCSFVRLNIAPGDYVITIPALKSEYETAMETQKEYVTAIFADGSMRSWSDPDDAPSSPTELDRPGELFRFSPELCDVITALIDGAGTPLLRSVPSEVSAIAEEEISAMTAGASTPENCAKVIQSRVSIWMAEHR